MALVKAILVGLVASQLSMEVWSGKCEEEIYSIKLDNGDTLLHKAAFYGWKEVAENILKLGAEIDVTNEEGQTPLYKAAERNMTSILALLILNDANVNSVEKTNNYTQLHLAVKNGHIRVIKILLESGADLNAIAGPGITPLHLAVREGNIEIVKMLLQKGVNVDIKDATSRTPLFDAVEAKQNDIIELLLSKGASVEAKDVHGKTPLEMAVQCKAAVIAELLITKGANVSTRNEGGRVPLHIAAWQGATDSGQMLLKKGAKVDELDNAGRSPLHEAAYYGQLDFAKILLDNGANVNLKDTEKGFTPMYLANINNQPKMVDFLKSKGGTM